MEKDKEEDDKDKEEDDKEEDDKIEEEIPEPKKHKSLENFVFGEEALKYEGDKEWVVRKPIKFGYFNVSDGYSLGAIERDLE
jgi:hypothetical protein